MATLYTSMQLNNNQDQIFKITFTKDSTLLTETDKENPMH